MNAHGETWTAERSITFLIESRLFSELNAPSIVDGLRTALAIVRLHPRLVDVLEDAADYIHHTGGSVTMINGTLARAHALGSPE